MWRFSIRSQAAAAIAALSAISFTAAGCGGDVNSGGSGAGGNGSTGNGNASTGSGSASTSSGQTGSSGVGGGLCEPPPQEIASSQSITFEVTNMATADRYLVTSGHGCEAYGFEVKQG